MSNREVGLKGREKGKTMSSCVCTESHKDEKDADKSSNTQTTSFVVA